ncbi:glycosyltransferase family 87 protein [Austwickia chelonae]|uniref:glycosyltransferase family 87 protein n=1 Tax=Austwickia chelonae TaxID=100225 RepID=UPI0013C2BF50|nr:glycosyltransferase 87 family protein [Austwickia chelonae]
MQTRTTRNIPNPHQDPVPRAAAAFFGGPLGRRIRLDDVRGWRGSLAGITFVGAVMVALGLFQKGHCLANGWGAPESFWRACYSDLPFLYAGTPLAEGGFPYVPNAAVFSQPPLTGMLMWLVALITPGGEPFDQQRWNFVLWAVLTVAILTVLIVVIARSCSRAPWRVVHVAASPLLVTAVLVSPDLFAVTLASLALLLWGREQPEWAGVVFGAAIAAHTYTGLLVLVVCLLALRSGRLRSWSVMAGATLLSFCGVMVAIFGLSVWAGSAQGLADLGGLLAPYRLWFNGGPDYGSLWFLPRLWGVEVTPGWAVTFSALGWVVALLAGAGVALSAARRPTIAELAIIVVGVVLITGRTIPVQSSLWLLPLVALAGLRWRDHLIWVSTELCYFVAIWLYLGGLSDAARAFPMSWFLFFSLLRLAGIGWLVAAAWTQAVRRPAYPQDEALGSGRVEEHDELAGPMSGRGDRLTLVLR